MKYTQRKIVRYTVHIAIWYGNHLQKPQAVNSLSGGTD